MTTTSQDRTVIREWRDHHSDVQPDRDGHPCKRQVWCNDKPAGQCGRTSAWFVDFGPPLGPRPLCEEHTVSYIRSHAALEAARKEMS